MLKVKEFTLLGKSKIHLYSKNKSLVLGCGAKLFNRTNEVIGLPVDANTDINNIDMFWVR